ncbi:MAG: major royal jelly protein [Myxococcaceae bacterium]|nr:major royal jelly protein [Myxococcaceae bacterium]
MRAVSFVVASSLAALGCMSNIATVKSTQAPEVKPITDAGVLQDEHPLATVQGGPAKGRRDPRLEPVALFPGPAQPVGIALSKSGRLFMSFPRWADPVKNTVVELRDGQLAPFPDARINEFDGSKLDQYPPDQHLISVQAIVFDSNDRLWLLDPGSFNFAPNILGGPKLWAYDINTGMRVKAISFPTDVALKNSYLNDVRFDLTRGVEGFAYITDSGVGGIIVVDLANGSSWRHLDQHPSVLPTPGLKQESEGAPLLMRKANGEVMSPDLRSDGIALSPDNKTLYYTTVANRDVYAVPTDLLVDRNPALEAALAGAVRQVAHKPSGNDGILCDAAGRIYTTDFEDGAIRRVDPQTGSIDIVVQDERLLWPDTLALHGDLLYITSNQLARQPNFHDGQDRRKPPYALFRVRVGEPSKEPVE